MKKVAVVGIQGVPAQYGGFESLVENIIGEHSSDHVRYTVFCSRKDMVHNHGMKEYKGASLKYVHLRANGIQSIPYDILSLLRSVKGYDVILLLGTSGCCFLPFFRLFCKKRLIINIDGLEHRRAKWGKATQSFLKFSESMAVRYANVIVSDNKGIQDYVRQTYGKDSVLIAYGGDHALRQVDDVVCHRILENYGLKPNGYSISVCRIEPENNCHITLEAFSRTSQNLVFVGNWKNSEYGRDLLRQYEACPNIRMLDPIYDLDTLYVLRSNAANYIHGHSAGGTNPSLVEAMFYGIPVLAYDVVYNRETTHHQAYYFRDVDSLLSLLGRVDLDGSPMRQLAEERYTWKFIAQEYEKLYGIE